MENLNLNLNKGADDVLTEAAGYFADQGYSVLNQGFAEIVSSPRLSKEYIEALTEGCNANDKAVMTTLMNNTCETILNESLGGIMPLSSLSMPVIRKLWPRVSMKEAIKTIPATAPIFSIVYTKPYLYRIDEHGVEHRKDLPRGAFSQNGYDAELDARRIEEPVEILNNNVGQFVDVDFGAEIDADFEVVSVDIDADNATHDKVITKTGIIGKKLGLSNEIIADVTVGGQTGTVIVRVNLAGENKGKAKVAVLGITGKTKVTVNLVAHKTSEWNDVSWDVNFDMPRQEIRIGTGEHLNAPLSVEQVQDAKALYNMDAAAEIADIMTNVFAQKLDHEIINFLAKCLVNRPSNPEWAGLGDASKHMYKFSVAPSAGYAGSPKAWREELKPVVDFAATALMQETYFQSGSFVIYGNPVDTALLTNVDWQYKGGTSGNVDGVAINYSVGVFQSGSYVYKVVSSLNVKPGQLMLSFIPSGDKQLTTAYYPYSFVMEKGTGYRSPNHPLTPSIMMTKRHTFFEFTPAIAVIAIEGNNGVGQFNGGNLFTNTFAKATSTDGQ